MTIDMTPDAPRRASRAVALLVGAAVAALAAPAAAAPPDTWEQPESRSLLSELTYLVGVPLLVVAVITLLVYLPGMVRRQSGEPAGSFGDEPEWFGGPRAGLEAAGRNDTADAPVEETKGGAGARW